MSLKNKLAQMLIGCGLLTSTFAATESVELTGKVVDQFNSPVGGVEVEVESLGLKDTTGAEGTWSIATEAVNPVKVTPAFEVKLTEDVLSFNLKSKSPLKLNMTDASGQSVYNLQKTLDQGFQSLNLPSEMAFGVYYLQITLNGQTQVLQLYKSMVDYHKQGLSIPRLNKEVVPAMATSKADKLVYRLQGYILTADDIASYRQYIEKFLETRNISGKITPSSKTIISKVYANFTGGKMPGELVTRLGWNKQNDLYSGKVYSVKPLAGNVFDYKVFVFGQDAAGHKTSQGKLFEFDSYFQDLDIPIFIAGNAMPRGSIEGENNELVNRDITLTANVNDVYGSIVKYEWDLATGSFVTGTSSATFKNTSSGSFVIKLRVTDDDANTSTFTKTINLSNQAAVVSGVKDTTITPNDVIAFSFSANDVDGVTKVLWGFGDGSKDSTLHNGTDIVSSLNHTYPSQSVVLPGVSKVFPLRVVVFNKLGDSSVTTKSITVENDIPVVEAKAYREVLNGIDSAQVKILSSVDKGTVTYTLNYMDGVKIGDFSDSLYNFVLRSVNDSLLVLSSNDADGNSDLDTLVVNLVFTDARDGQKYQTVKIGTQTWMAENLNYGAYVNDSSFSLFYQNGAQKFCYGNVEANCATDGGLYQWHTAMNFAKSCGDGTTSCASQISSGNHQGICPSGWHMPKQAEWDTLQTYLGGSSVAGKTMKLNTTGNSSWVASTNNDGNSSGFSALPSGFRGYNGGFYDRGNDATFWEAVEYYSGSALYRTLSNGYTSLRRNEYNKRFGFSVRCMQGS